MYFYPNKTIIFEFTSYSYGKNLREAYSSKQQKSHVEHNMNYMMYLCSGILRESKGGGCAMLQ